jgi:hypothetical protein
MTASLLIRQRSSPSCRSGTPADEFLAGAELQRFRIRAIDPTFDVDAPGPPFHALWVVEPV